MKREDGHVGQKVYFGSRNGQKTLGEIVKVNPKKFKVKQLEQRGVHKNHAVGTVWTVPPSLCTPADEGRPAQVTRSRRSNRPCLVNVLTGERTYGRRGESHDSLFGRLANGLLD